MGSGPFDEIEFDDLLREYGIQLFERSPNVETVIVGYDGWEKNLLEMLFLRRGKSFKVYSQEMFLSYLLTGRNPFDYSRKTLLGFAQGHSALMFLSNWGFKWPSIEVSENFGSTNIIANWPKKGALGLLGYKVGRTGLSVHMRQTILRLVFQIDLTDILASLPSWYTEEWGDPDSARRLEKMADSISSFCRNAKRRQRRSSHQMDPSIEDWESDLDWLRENFYDELGFGFQWPDTELWR